MVIRGAPAIGVAAAMGAALGVLHSPRHPSKFSALNSRDLRHARKNPPTAVDLFWALERMRRRFCRLTPETSDLAESGRNGRGSPAGSSRKTRYRRSTSAASARNSCPRSQVMTQCNAGALATGGIGSALGVIRVAFEQGKKIHVLVPETRPYLQGARLTAWELHKGGIPLTLITTIWWVTS